MDRPDPNAALGHEPIRTISREGHDADLSSGDDFRPIMALNRWSFDAKRMPATEHVDTPEDLHESVKPDEEIVVNCSNVDCLSSVALYRDLVARGYQSVS